MIDDTLSSFYRMNFELTYEHNISMSELYDMIPWEREIYYYMVLKRVQEKNSEQQ